MLQQKFGLAQLYQLRGRVGRYKHQAYAYLLIPGLLAISAEAKQRLIAIEELSGSFERGVSGTIITTVVLSGIVAQYLLGNYTYFGSSMASLDFVKGWLPFLIVTILLFLNP